MKFGKLPNVDHIDFSLPPSHPKTMAMLQNFRDDESPEIYVGCAKWSNPEWVGNLYPPKTKSKDFLKRYAEQFNSIELNTTHYGIKSNEVIEKWASQANEGFRFSPKFPQVISHIYRLNNAHESTVRFMDAVSHFGNKLGESFLQMPPNFTTNHMKTLENYLQSLPAHFPVSLELRHEDWYADHEWFEKVFDLMESCNVGSVITDTAGRQDCLHQRLTKPVAFIRFVGNNLHPSDYARLDAWIDRLKEWLDAGLQVLYFYMHQEDELATVELCDYFINEMNKKCRLRLKRPDFYNKTAQSALF